MSKHGEQSLRDAGFTESFIDKARRIASVPKSVQDAYFKR